MALIYSLRFLSLLALTLTSLGVSVTGEVCDPSEYVEHPWDECACAGQFFSNEDCTEAFYCADEDSNLGCHLICPDGQIIDFNSEDWTCVEDDPDLIQCPGTFNLACPDDPVSVGPEGCDCANELIVGGDCLSAYYCQVEANGGGLHECEEGEEVEIDFDTWTLSCVASEGGGSCDLLGGFKIGCQGGAPTPPPSDFFCTALEHNPLQGADCQCEGQIFLTTDCRRSFLCTDMFGAQYEGCMVECDSDEYVGYDPDNGLGWGCYQRGAGFQCKGNFQYDCPDPNNPDAFNVDCHCDGEYWQSTDCKTGFLCYDDTEDGETNEGAYVTCDDPGDIIVGTYFNDGEHECTSDVDQCRGGFHYGCTDDDLDGAGTLESAVITVSAATLLAVLLAQ